MILSCDRCNVETSHVCAMRRHLREHTGDTAVYLRDEHGTYAVLNATSLAIISCKCESH